MTRILSRECADIETEAAAPLERILHLVSCIPIAPSFNSKLLNMSCGGFVLACELLLLVADSSKNWL